MKQYDRMKAPKVKSNKSPSSLTFKCNFGEGVICTIEVADQPSVTMGRVNIQRIDWSRNPNDDMLRPYIDWMHGVHQTLANKWRKRLIKFYRVLDGSAELWTYVPGKEPDFCGRGIPSFWHCTLE